MRCKEAGCLQLGEFQCDTKKQVIIKYIPREGVNYINLRGWCILLCNLF